jgi:hypothetical protein
MILKLIKLLGIDKSIAFVVLNRGWVLISGVVTLTFVVTNLSEVEQGFYFTFLSILGLQVFFELGLGFVVMQTTSHLMKGVAFDKRQLVGDSDSIAKISNFFIDAAKWYGAISILFIFIILFAGLLFFSSAELQSEITWETPWIFLVIVFGLTIVVNACFSFLEGVGRIADMALARLTQSVLSVAILWIGFILDFNLFSLSLMYLAQLCVGILWVILKYKNLLMFLVANRSIKNRINWRNDVWPFQWRISVSWIAGYFGFQALTPIIFSQMGPVAAGQMGLIFSIMMAISSGSIAWVSTKSARFGRLVAEERYSDLNVMYKDSSRISMILAFISMFLFILIVSIATQYLPNFVSRLPSLEVILLISIGVLSNNYISIQALYLRSFKQELFMSLSIASGILVTLSTVASSIYLNMTYVAGGYGMIMLAILVFWSTPILNRFRSKFIEE